LKGSDFIKLWIYIETTFSALGGLLAAFLGGFDGLIQSLVIFSVIDYITGIFNAVVQKNVSSNIGFKGIVKKFVMFLIVGIVSAVDSRLFGLIGMDGNIIRDAVICFFLANEGISVLENSALLGVPIPEQLKDALLQIRNRKNKNSSDSSDNGNDNNNDVNKQ